MNQTILVTGGTGYIGSHTVVELLAGGYTVFVIDNICNSKVSVLKRIERITGRRPGFAEVDVRDRPTLQDLFAQHRFDAVIHFAGLKAVAESVARPLEYFDNNVTGIITLLKCMVSAGVKTFVFSSSATVYGESPAARFSEQSPLSPINPYGRSKLISEEILRDLARSDPAWRIAVLRYFNPVGAHPSGVIGEDPHGTPNNLMPYIAQVAMGTLKELPVFGDDYPTTDGTGVRDYIHVVDLALGHLAALKALSIRTGVTTVNLGSGRGYSVMEMVRAFAAASGQPVPYRIMGRRPGDLAECVADPALSSEALGWQTRLGIDAMCADTWRWQQWAAQNLSPSQQQ